VIVKVTTAAICGSDLHMYQGRTAAENGLVFGHENMGVVIEKGSGVTLLEKGDRIVLPFSKFLIIVVVIIIIISPRRCMW
jgi:threonine dehydrogenase-like Zn-dependent dehydrogenase